MPNWGDATRRSHLAQRVQAVAHAADHRCHYEPVSPVSPGSRWRRLPRILWVLLVVRLRRPGRRAAVLCWRARWRRLSAGPGERGVDFLLREVLGPEKRDLVLDRRRGNAWILQDWYLVSSQCTTGESSVRGLATDIAPASEVSEVGPVQRDTAKESLTAEATMSSRIAMMD